MFDCPCILAVQVSLLTELGLEDANLLLPGTGGTLVMLAAEQGLVPKLARTHRNAEETH